jgi:N-acyl homoserine lactone hydrolase
MALVLFDTGLGIAGSERRRDQRLVRELEARYQPRPRPIEAILARERIAIEDVDVVVNCHLHPDHAGQNIAFRGVPIYVQPAEREAARNPDYTIPAWVDSPGVTYRPVEGDHEILPGIMIVATPGHSPGHHSLLVDADAGPTILAGQAVYSVGEWTGRAGAREGRSSARDQPAYDRSVEHLKALDPVRVWFGHDRETWVRGAS